MKPILFNTEMVRAILEGRKTVTRRVVKFQKGLNPNWTGYIKDGLTLYNGRNEPCSLPAPYKVGDVLYVRETWRELIRPIGTPTEYYYKADTDKSMVSFYRWKPSIHMPKEAARLFLRVTGVRVEKLRDMELEDFIKEGITLSREDMRNHDTALYKARELFKDLWNSTAGKPYTPERYANSWIGNPYVWVIEFRVLPILEAKGN